MSKKRAQRSDSKKPLVMALVAHPDDFAHSMGGTALLLSAQYRLHVLCLTRGERGIAGATMRDAGAIREKEERRADALAGATVRFLDGIDGEVFAERGICQRVAALMRRRKPVAVFSLWPLNVPDHFMAYAVAMKALHLSGRFYETEVYLSENGIGGQTNQFDPDLYVDIGDVIERKKEMLRCHRSQNPDEPALQRVLQRNRLRGMITRGEYAEAFKTVMPLANRRWSRPAGSLLLRL